ncbi:MAG: CRISPR-associated endonuclease Cas2 [Candidatus Methylacidiphilales bacterium]
MKSGSVYLAVYDISDDRERTRLAKVLEAFGIRIQKSAFELRLTRAQRETILKQVHDLKLNTGWVGFYRIDEAAKRHTAGTLPADFIDPNGPCFIQ